MMTSDEARAHLRELQRRLTAGTATPGEHRPAVLAAMALRGREREEWLTYLWQAFRDVPT